MDNTVALLVIVVLAMATLLGIVALWVGDAARANEIEHDLSRLDTAPHPGMPVTRHLYALPPMPPSERDFDGGLGMWGRHVERRRAAGH